MLRSRALRSGVRVSTPDGAAGSRLPALLALPHPQPFVRTIFARGSLSVRIKIWEAATRARYKRTVNRGQKRGRRRENRLRDSRGGAGEDQEPPPAASGAQEGVQSGLDDPGFWRLKLPQIGVSQRFSIAPSRYLEY